MNAHNSTNRFSDRADNYHLYRPGYPAAVIPYLETTIGLNKKSSIADIGSGTGIFASLFLKAGYAVKAVEPNIDMRLAAEKNLNHHPGFQSIAAAAEHSSLSDNSIDLITVAQAFHWFDHDKVKKEFKRILAPGGHVLLVWNILQKDNPFLQAYAALKEKYAENIAHPDRANLDVIRAFFYPAPVTTHQLQNVQLLDAESFKGYLLSFSTVPLQTESRYKEMINELEILHVQYAENGLVKMEYQTMLYLAQVYW